MDVLRHYPIYPGSLLLLYASYLLPVALLLVALQRSGLQSNCRIILTTWAIGMLGILTNEMYLMCINMTLVDGEFISKSLHVPSSRPIITVVHTVFYICTSALELLVALERAFAIRWADSAVEPRSICWFLVPYLAVWSAIAAYTAKLAFIEFNMLVICVTFIAVEISSITFSAGIISWVYAFCYEQIPYFVLEAVYQTLHATSCAVAAIVLMRQHPRIKRECLRILHKLFPRIQISNSTHSSGGDGAVYFAMLSKSWSSESIAEPHVAQC